jgi:hypothetical protein
MKILKITILILLTTLTSCKKEIPNIVTSQTKIVDTTLQTTKKNQIETQWLDIPDGYASFIQFDYNNDKIDDVIMFEGYDVNVKYNWPGPMFYNGNPLTKINLPIDNKKIFGSKLIAADFNGDGYKDIFVQSGMDPSGTDWVTCWYCDPILPNNIMFNNEGKSFNVKELTDWKGIWRSATAGDIDNDGDTDLLIFTTHQGKGLYNKLLINDGKGNFSLRKSDIDSIEWVDAAEMFDINKDGFSDLVINDIVSTGNRFRILWGNGNNFYESNSTTINITNNMWVLDIDAFDFDKDGYAEMIITMNKPSGEWKLHMFKTNDNKNYNDITNEISGNITNSIAYSHLIDIGDIDGNGKVDVYVTDKSKKIRWEYDGNKLIKQ